MKLLKHTRSILMLAASLFFALIVGAQPKNSILKDVAMPAPNAASLGKYGDIPVSYFTGVPNIAVPIYNAQEGPLSLPVSVSYHASGIKIGEPASWVGMGWSLQAGGSISRTMMGMPDELGGGYLVSGANLVAPMQNNNQTSTTQMTEVINGQRDAEPDLFNFSVGGYSGKFVFDKDGNYNFIPKADLKLEYYTNTSNQLHEIIRFVVTTPDGTRYTFGTLENELPSAAVAGVEVNTYDNQNSNTICPSSWHLRRIENYDRKFKILLEYEAEFYNYQSLASCSITWNQSPGATNTPNCPSTPLNNYVSGKRLRKIITTTEVIHFMGVTNRQDLNSTNGTKQLDYVEIKSVATSACFKRFDFFYSYFSDPAGSASYYKRLRLDSLRERACDNSIVIPAHKFTYAAGTVPQRLSKAIDHWGYANGAILNESKYGIPPLTSQPTFQGQVVNPLFANSDRETNETSMQIGNLQRITYPTGGYNQFTYEANDYSTTTGTTTTVTQVVMPEVSNCSYPQASCCTTQQGVNTFTFTSDQLNQLKFKLSLYNLNNVPTNPSSYKFCNTGNSNPPQASVGIYIKRTSDNVAVGAYSFNLANNDDYHEIIGPLTNITTLSPGVSYTFTIQVSWGKGAFSLFKETTSNNTTLVNRKVGGLRIKEIRTHDGLNVANDVVKQYKYEISPGQSSGYLYNQPEYWGYHYDVFNQILGVTFYATSVVPMTNVNGYTIGYQRVEEETIGAGKMAYTFSLEAPWGSQQSYPYSPQQAMVRDGQASGTKAYNSSSAVVSESQTTYQNDPYSYLPGIMYKAYEFPVYNSSGTFNAIYAKTYEIRTAPLRVQEEKTTQDGVQTIKTYEYDALNRHLAPVASNVTNSDNTVFKTKMTYPHDLPTANTQRALLLGYNLLSPLKTVAMVNNAVINGDSLRYSLYDAGGLPVASGAGLYLYPWQHYRYEATFDYAGGIAAGAAWVLKGTLDKIYPLTGLPNEFSIANWPKETYEWETNFLIKKRTYQNFNWEYTYHPGTRLVKSIKNIDGQMAWYRYDQLQRIKVDSARNGNVVTTYDYIYRGGSNLYNTVKSTTTLTAVSGSSLISKATAQIMDGLGRPIEDIKIKHNPTKGQDGATSSATDVVTHYKYDAQGRMYQQSLPFVSPNTNGTYYAPPVGTKYSTSTFEASPLSRTLTVTPPDWYPTSSAYGTNAANEVLVPGTTATYFAAGTLFKTTVTDADNRVSISYADKKGRLILKRQTDTGNTTPADTYYQYDNKDRVIRVMPPGVAAATTNLVFAYQYDARDRMIRKKVPDMGSINMRYNLRDQLVFVQDSLQMGSTRCLGTTYDAYGRPTQSGFVAGFPTNADAVFSFSEVLSKTWYDGYDGVNQVNLTTKPQYRGKVRKSETKVLDASNTWLYNVIDYDRHGRDSVINGNNLLNPTVSNAEAVSMTYDWADNALAETRTHTPGAAGATGAFSIQNTYTYDHVGRRTNFLTTIGGIGQHVAEYNYNHRDELIEKNLHANQVASAWGWLQSIDYSYNTQGWLTGVNNWNTSATVNTPALCTPAMPNPASPARSTYNESSDLFMLDMRYDQPEIGIAGLTAAPAQKAGNISQIIYRVRGREASIVSYSYDYLSRLSSSTFHNYSDAGVISGTNNYNENLTYDLRGNIQTLQRTGFYTNGSTCTYGQIDNLTYSYTANTNRLHKVLDGTVTAGDAKSRGFNGNLSTVDNSMTYDRNGNLNKNLHKNVSTITYNHLNLPTVITFTTGNTIEFLYDAAGTKLRKTVKVGATVQYVQDYLPGGIEYRQTGAGVKRVESVFHAEGRYYNTNVDASNTISWRKEYNFKDHLGNTRLVFTDRNANGIVDITGTASTSDVLQENHYYAFGLAFEGAWLQNDAGVRDNKYGYNSKELNDDFGLNWNDYGARWYDGSIGRWNAVDPMAYIYYGFSPYNYTINNPILLIDPDGRIVTFTGNAQLRNGLQNTMNQHFGVEGVFQIGDDGQLSVKDLSEEQQKKLSTEQLSAYTEIKNISNAGFEVRFDLVDENTSWSQSDDISGKTIFGDDYALGVMDVGDISKMGQDVGRALVHMLHEQAIADNPATFNSDRSAQRMDYTNAHKRAMKNDLRKIGWTYDNDMHGNVNGNYVVYRDAVDSNGKILRSTKITMVSRDNQTILNYENVNRYDSQNQQIINENNFTKVGGK